MTTTDPTLIIALIIGLLAGLAYSATSVGYGALVILPLIALGIDAHVAVAAALVSVAIISLIAGALHGIKTTLHMRLLLPLIAGGVLGAFSGSLLSVNYLPEDVLKTLIALVVMAGGTIYLIRSRVSVKWKVNEGILPGVVFGAAVVGGIITGAIGLGWGYITVPVLLFLGIDTNELVGASLLARGFMSAGGAVNHLKALTPESYPIILILTATGAVAAVGGTYISKRVQPAKLRKGLMIWIMLLAVWLFVQTVGAL